MCTKDMTSSTQPAHMVHLLDYGKNAGFSQVIWDLVLTYKQGGFGDAGR